jgi:oligopeptide transport system substrate-binding protein
MRPGARNLYAAFMVVLFATAVVWAMMRGRLPPADFTFVNGTEIKSIDPAITTGVPDGRIIGALFEGLYRQHPDTLEPLPALAERYELSEDKKTYTFYIRRGCKWSDGTSLDAHDVAWSWMRFAHPETASQYAYQLTSYVELTEQYNSATVNVGDPVEVELADRPDHPAGKRQLFPRGTIVLGVLRGIDKPPEPRFADGIDEKKKIDKIAEWKRQWVYTVEVDGKQRKFSKDKLDGAEQCEYVLLDFNKCGITVVDDHTLKVRLKNPTPYFLQLMSFYPLYPVNRACIEKYGVPNWTKPGNMVVSGGYKIEFRRIRDRIRLVKNPNYWNADSVQLETIDALAVNSSTTGLNMYLTGAADWITDVPAAVIPDLKDDPQYSSSPMLTTEFYRLNVTRPPLTDRRVRLALNMAINKTEIVERITRAGQVPARSLVPPIHGYTDALCPPYDVERAKELLAEAGFPGGKGLPPVEILYNTLDDHRTLAEKIMSDWKQIGVDVELKNQEWGVYLDAQRSMQYTVARAGWVADYADPNTFLDMFVTDGPNNETGWSNARYDEIILKLAPEELNREKRMELLHEAEQILMDDQVIIPIYFKVSKNMVRPEVRGFHANVLDQHPLVFLSIERNGVSGETGAER